MRVLLDTHTFIWYAENNPALSLRAADLIDDTDNDALLSAVSAYEIIVKYRKGLWPTVAPIALDVLGTAQSMGIGILDVGIRHTIMAANFTDEHKDPFDRIIAAQSLAEGIPLLTRDEGIALFKPLIIW